MLVWLWAVVAGFVTAQFSILLTTVYLHRGMTHRAIRFHPSADFAFRGLLWLLTGVFPRQWIAVHRKHHRFTDVVGDPHSPYLEGFWNIQLFNYKYYFKEIHDKAVVREYAADIPEDGCDRLVFRHGWAGLVLSTLLFCLALGWWGLLASASSMLFYVFLSSTINGLCHWVGRRNFENTARNVQAVAWFSAGEGLHNNHHAFPSCPKLSMRGDEWDPGWFLIRVLQLCGLCMPARTVSLDAPVLHPTVAKRLAGKPVLVQAEES